jgi:exonuclease III
MAHPGGVDSSRLEPHGAPNRRRTHRRRRRGAQTGERTDPVPNLRFAVLNLNGARTRKKWALVEVEILKEHRVDILLVSETRLMNREKPPRMQGFRWVGNNREGPSGESASGGVGILAASHLNLEQTGEGEDWIAAEIRVGAESWMVISVYCTHSSVSKNKTQLRTISDFIENKCNGKGLIIGGDFNAHTHLFANCNDSRGRLLLEFAENAGLVILNSTDKCKGRYTRGSATIDYILCNDKVLQACQSMNIDEQREVTRISDHNLLSMTCLTPTVGAAQEGKRIRIMNAQRAAEMTNKIIRKIKKSQNKITYEAIKEAIRSSIRRATKDFKVGKDNLYSSKTIREVVREKKETGRRWRKARKDGDPAEIAQTEEQFRAMQVKLGAAVTKEERRRYESLSRQILSGPRGERAKKFWKYVTKHTKKNTQQIRIKGQDGVEIPKEALEQHLTEVACAALMAEPAELERAPETPGSPSGIRTSNEEIERILAQISTKTATGDDQIPASVIKSAKEEGVDWLTELLNHILEGEEPIPMDWRDGRVSLIEKPNSKKGVLETYRPITISTVLYRIFTKILASRISGWMEEEEVVGEMQNGFRRERRGEDNLFIVTSAIEMTRRQNKGLITCFLDCTKAYDRISRDSLWETLRDLGMDIRWIGLLRSLYADNSVVLKVGDINSKRVRTEVGLRQGCPLSPILFALYIAELESRLLWTKCGFEVTGESDEASTVLTIPGLLYADDLVLMAHSYEEMSRLLSVTTEVGNEKSLQFNPAKSAMVIFNATRLGEPREMTIQGKDIEFRDDYKYLGITLCNKTNYLLLQEQIWKKEAHKVLQRLHAQCLWTFNRFEITRIQWMATAVPKLTYANAVLASRASKQMAATFDRTQVAAGKWAMGITGYRVASDFVLGELGWSTFEAREAQSKIRYFTRVSAMEPSRWPRMVLSMMASEKIFPEALRRLNFLKDKYGCSGIPLEYREDRSTRITLFHNNVKKHIKEKMNETWKESINSKSSLSYYKKWKERGVTAHGLYQNSRGSALLALSRAGMLPTRAFRAKFENIDPHCSRCGVELETIPHILMKCGPHDPETEELARRMGFTEQRDEEAWEDARRTLEKWEKETRRTC